MTIVPSDLEMRAVDVFFVAAVDGNLTDENWLNERISWEGGGESILTFRWNDNSKCQLENVQQKYLSCSIWQAPELHTKYFYSWKTTIFGSN